MSIHPEIKKAIEIIDERIASLRNIREALAKEFGMESVLTPPSADEPEQLVMTASPSEKLTRKSQVVAFLRRNGKASRRKIAADLGIPEGTVSYVLNHKDLFYRDDNGEWGIVEGREPIQ